MTENPLHLRVIVNPAAGKDEPFLNLFNTIFREANYDWEVAITKEAGDGEKLAKAAIMDGVDMIAVYGGDGTVGDVARAMRNSSIPMGIIPGGTGNVMALDLGIPMDLEGSCRLLTGSHTIRNVDMILANDHYFFLRVSSGIEANIIEGAPREAKDRYGYFAYVIAGLEAFIEPEHVLYQLIVDNERFESEGIGCIVANTGQIGILGLSIGPGVSVDDGLLDVFVIRRGDLASLLSLSANVLTGKEDEGQILHLRGKRIDVMTDPIQTIQGDGEMLGTTPISVRVLPNCLRVIVPPNGQSSTITG